MIESLPWLALLNIIAVDLVLSGDNAVVIGMAVRRLPPALARRAALIGAAFAVGLRVLFTAIAAWLLAVPLLQAVGGAVLLVVAWKLLQGGGDHAEVAAAEGFWPAVKAIVLADLVMSLDNILAVGGAAHGNLWLLLFGLGLSIPLVLGGSAVVTGALRRWPALEVVGAGVLAVTAAHMLTADPLVKAWLATGGLGPVAQALPLIVVAAFGGWHLGRGRALAALR